MSREWLTYREIDLHGRVRFTLHPDSVAEKSVGTRQAPYVC